MMGFQGFRIRGPYQGTIGSGLDYCGLVSVINFLGAMI